ncbi:MAG: Rpn family recombination-promoting nuclease/putative transposase [Candidatus Gracilibacteria bacterium]|nr:Rpn family recombination-promoting nuclease/putative transposase [Candidatus Gracilibacteria bacterium]
MVKFINPRTDFAFKRIFGSEESKEILMSFLNALLNLEGKNEIKEVEILDPYQAPKIKGLKDTYLDLKVKTEGGKKIIIEMQVLNIKGFDKRVLYNMSKAYANQIEKGEDYLKLKPVIALTITDFIMFDNQKKEKYISTFIYKEKEENTFYNGDTEMVFVELPLLTTKKSQLIKSWDFFYISGNKTSHQNKLKIAEKVSFSCFLKVQI